MMVVLMRAPGAALTLAATMLVGSGAAAGAVGTRTVVVGRSVEHRPIRAVIVGPRDAGRSLLIVGCVHGNEPAGKAVTRALRRAVPPAGVALWLVDAVNPDGCRVNTRQNARGVDLNRNSPWRWRSLDAPGGLFWSGPHAASEPETRAILRLVRRLKPAVSIWYHQHAGLVNDAGGDRRIERHYARLVGLPFRRFGAPSGNFTSWQDAMFPGDTAFVVELPAGPMSRRAVRHHVAAVLSVARGGRRSASTGR